LQPACSGIAVFERRVAVVVTAFAVAGPTACAEQGQVLSVGPQQVQTVPPAAVAGPYVPSVTLFTARIDAPLDTFYTAPGSTFDAVVVTPLVGPDGRILVPYGAELFGTFVSQGSPDRPRILVAIHAVDTVDGTVPVAAVVRSAQHVDWIGPPVPEPLFGYEYPHEQPAQVRVPRGALIELQLVEPLLLPDARLALPPSAPAQPR
jgi:hypothetical protein